MEGAFRKNSEKRSISVTRYFRSHVLRVSDTLGISLLPNILFDYKFTEAKHGIEINGIVTTLKFPKVNEILTSYCSECLQTYSTIAFIELVNAQFAPTKIFSFTNEKLEYAISLYNRIYNLPSTLESARNTLAYYFGNSLDVFSFSTDEATKVANLRNSLKAIEIKYANKLIQEVLPNAVTYENGKLLDPATINWFITQKAGKVLNKEVADWFINRANEEMKFDVEVEFAKNKLRALMFNADEIISDPRFRMSLEDKRWSDYDETIKNEVAFYNRKFASTPGFAPLDWRYVKAMVWTEVMAGPTNAAWQSKPMQIGVPGDPGIEVVKSGSENSNLITTEELRRQIQGNITGNNNIKAGIAYLFTIAIRNSPNQRDRVDFHDVIDDLTIQSQAVAKGETAETIARKFNTTVESIIKNTDGMTKQNIVSLKPGQVIKFQKAHREPYIVSWRDWKSTIRSYNGNAIRSVDKSGKSVVTGKGDPSYLEKLERAYQIIISRQQ
jgi:hypothetical protein